ncbi:serine protease [Streptomyces sp. HPF1205]|uniref:serine protease n=1 Tax=Streptomyces sp. HPF1205 TaxID=2873262 RepID=UPI001CED541B|nr:serine protease [Streptomyces sp. HPF1205]
MAAHSGSPHGRGGAAHAGGNRPAYGAERGDAVIRVRDLAGRPRGTGFLADGDGTMITSHEAVDGLARLVLHAPGDQVCLVESGAITPLPEQGLALVATEGLSLPPLPVAAGGPAHPERRIRLPLPAAHGVVVGTGAVTYTATDRFHLLDEVYEIALDGTEVGRLGPGASGTPVIDAATGAVLAVVTVALHAGHRAGGFAVPLRALDAPAPLAGLLARNAATVPGQGPHLNLAGVLRLTGATVRSAAGAADWREPVERPEVADALRAFATSDDHTPVLAVVGAPGTGRTTALAALAAERARDPHPAPTVWLRGAELRPGDGGVKDAVERALRTAARVVGASRPGAFAPGEPPYASADAVREVARAAGRPLLIVLDAPEEMPPVLAHALPDWVAGTAGWLRAGGARLAVACRPEFWEQAGELMPPELLYGPPAGAGSPPPGAPLLPLPPCLRLGALDAGQAARARTRYALDAADMRPGDAGHPLALRLLSEVRAALPEDEGGPGARSGKGDGGAAPSRAEIFSAYVDLVCLRIAARLADAAEPPVRGSAMRRLAARVAGRVHEAARRCLGPGQGELDREAFEELFPWRTGWASAVLTEGLLVPAGAGYRFAHEELADWLQARHLDLGAALHALVHRWFTAPGTPAEAPVRLPQRAASAGAGGHPPVPPAPAVAPATAPRSLPVPRHRAGPVVQALLLAPPEARAAYLRALVGALDQAAGDEPPPAPADPRARARAARRSEAEWWATHLLREVMLRDAGAHREAAAELAGRIAARAGGAGTGAGNGSGSQGLGAFGPWFWRRLRLGPADRLELLRVLLPADGPPGTGRDRYLDVAADLLRAEPARAVPALCGWFGDDRPLRTAAGPDVPPLTVACAAQALLHTHRRLMPDHLAETLVDTAHPGADEVLAALAEDEPAAVCRAVDRWAQDPRPDRHAAAATYGCHAAPHVHADADRALLRDAALTLLARPADRALHGPALALLIHDPATRPRHLDAALRRFAAGDPGLTPSALVTALPTDPEPVLLAFQERLRRADEGAGELLRELAGVTDPALARRVAALVADQVRHRPEHAAAAAEFLDLRLEQGPRARPALLPLAAAVLRDHPPGVRRVVVPVFAAPGTGVSRPLRQELLDMALESEHDADVLDALLGAAARGCRRRPPVLTRDLVHRLGLLLGRTPEGAARFDRRIVELARAAPEFGGLVREWVADGGTWDALIGPSARRRLETQPAGTDGPADLPGTGPAATAGAPASRARAVGGGSGAGPREG